MSTDFFQQVREDVRDGARAPDLDAIHRAGRRRKRTRGIAAVAGVAALVLVVGGAVAAFPSRTVAPTTAEHLVHGPIAGKPIVLTARMKLIELQPMTEKLTYGIVQTGTGAYAIARTTDAGRHWASWSLPLQAQNQLVSKYTGRDVWIADEIASWMNFPVFVNDQTILLGNYLSRDGGQSWKEITGSQQHSIQRVQPIVLGADIDRIPTGWHLAVLQVGPNMRAGAIDPATGQWRQLANQPGKLTSSIRTGGTGTLWASYSDSSATNSQRDIPGTSGIAVSRDGGHSWTRHQVTGGAGTPVSSDGVHAYAELTKGVPNSGEVVSAGALVTNDGGQTWTKVDSTPALPFGGVPLPDGSIIGYPTVYTSCYQPNVDALVVTKDGGQTCSIVPQTRNIGRFGRNADGKYVMSDATLYPTNFRISSDGLNWTSVTAPPVGK